MVDAFAGEGGQDLGGVAVGVDGDAVGEFGGAVDAVGVRGADVDPGGEAAGEVADEDGRFVGGGDAAVAEGDAVGVFQAVGEDAGEHVLGVFGGWRATRSSRSW